MPVLEDLIERKKVKSETLATADGTQRLKTIPVTMEEAMKDDTFRGATKAELDTLIKYGVIIGVNSDNNLCNLPRRDGEKDDGIIGSPKKQPCLLDKCNTQAHGTPFCPSIMSLERDSF